MPLQATSGAASYDAFGGGVAVVPTYIEDVFSTYLYTGNGSTQTITNNIDLSTKGGLVWVKGRAGGPNAGADNNLLFDTVRGNNNYISSNQTQPQNWAGATSQLSFGSAGFSVDASGINGINTNNETIASWTFRKQPKFFDVVTYTGTGSNATISHNLGSEPGCIIVKRTDAAGTNWAVYHRGTSAGNKYLLLNSTAAEDSGFFWNPTSTTFDVSSTLSLTANGGTYICYLFAHNAGGFGLSGTDNVISCGSATMDGSGGATVNLGYEPQWVMIKRSDGAGAWYIEDTMRGLSVGSQTSLLAANSSAAEINDGNIYNSPTSTGFKFNTGMFPASSTFIYIAIRRGPMKVPTTGTSVYKSSLLAGNSSTQQITDLDFPPDLVMTKARNTSYGNRWTDRLRGFGYALRSDDVGAELNNTTIGVNPFNMNGYTVLSGNPYNQSGFNYVNHAFRRAPSFFDEVVSAGTGSTNQARTHNLGAVPELIIVKDRSSGAANWVVYSATLGQNFYLNLNNTNNQQASTGAWGTSAFTASTFYCLDTGTWCASIGNSGVFYLFATCPGVSKVGSYTGNGSTQTINCGFGAGGARFVLIKRTDSTGDWYVYDTARGMTTLTDPYLLFNTTDAEVATLGSVTTVSTGFALNSTILAAINVNAGTYIFLAIA